MGMLHSSTIFKNSVRASSGHEQKNSDLETKTQRLLIHASVSSFF